MLTPYRERGSRGGAKGRGRTSGSRGSVAAAATLLTLILAGCGGTVLTEGELPIVGGDPGSSPGLPPEAVEVPDDQVVTILQSAYSGLATERRQVVRSQASFDSVWASATNPFTGLDTIPAIDFDTQQVLVLAMGWRPTGGYMIEAGDVATSSDTLYAVVRELSPGVGCITTQALTRPVAMVAVPLAGDVVTFVEETTVQNCS